MTMEQADALIEQLGYTESVEDYEHNELGHVYCLNTGQTVVVTGPNQYRLVTSEE